MLRSHVPKAPVGRPKGVPPVGWGAPSIVSRQWRRSVLLRPLRNIAAADRKASGLKTLPQRARPVAGPSAEDFVGGASTPTLSAQVASLLRCGRSESVGPEDPPTKSEAGSRAIG
ncbi:DUF6053 domain-containing protein [Lysobacter enzymogenes]|uniref:DUF6053 domain-containing protein n=1 Tax=Lysobacter enzymogenes TaxID=69 RepID=UPI003D188AC5